MVLKSKSARSLRINADGVVEGHGEEGRYGEWGGEGRGGLVLSCLVSAQCATFCLMLLLSPGQTNLASSLASLSLTCVWRGRFKRIRIFSPTAQFVVHVRGDSRVSLQNVNDPNRWLKIKGNQLLGTVSTDPVFPSICTPVTASFRLSVHCCYHCKRLYGIFCFHSQTRRCLLSLDT